MAQQNNQRMPQNGLIICRGGGDLATGIVHRLHRAGFRVLILETDAPAAIRRQVSFCEAVYEKTATIEGVTAQLIGPVSAEKELRTAIEAVISEGNIPLFIDPDGEAIRILKPDIVIDAIIAKKNLGTTIDMAPLVIGIGPGFTAGTDVDLVIESMRGHNLGRIIEKGSALANTGVPGNIGGYTKERVIHAAEAGVLRNIHKIGDAVVQGEEIARIYTVDLCESVAESDPATSGDALNGKYVSVQATISGLIRGLIRDGYAVTKGFKIADIDPRESELKNCFTISDKSRSIGGSVLEAVCRYYAGGF